MPGECRQTTTVTHAQNLLESADISSDYVGECMGGAAGRVRGGGRKPCLGGAVGVHVALVVLLLPCTYLGGASQRPTPPLQTPAVLIRAGQLPRPRAGGGLPVLTGGLGWLPQPTQGHSLCILRPPLLEPAPTQTLAQHFLCAGCNRAPA
jgi:hypothetical protein